MRMNKFSKQSTVVLCLVALVFFTVSGAAPAMALDAVIWQYQKSEIKDGKRVVTGRMTNTADRTVTQLGFRSWQYVQNGKVIEKSSRSAVLLKKPLAPGASGSLTFTLADTADVSDFTVKLHEVTFAQEEHRAGASAPRAAQRDLDKIKPVILSTDPGSTGQEYEIVLALHNNTDQAVRSLKVRITQNYRSGEPYVKTQTFSWKSPIAPNAHGTIRGKTPTRSMTGTNTKVDIVDAEFEPYEKPTIPQGPGSGNAMWSISETKRSDGKLVFTTSFLNNTAEDIVAINTYTLSFTHDGGKYVSYRGPLTLNTPVKSYEKMNITVSVPDARVFSNVRNIAISDITYMTRPVSARSTASSGNGGNSGNGGGGVSYNYKRAGWNSSYDRVIVTYEILNNSASQPLVRLDDVVISYTGTLENEFGWKTPKQSGSSNFQSMTVNIPPLGKKSFKFTLRKGYSEISNVKIRATPRFGEAKKQDDTGTTIIIK